MADCPGREIRQGSHGRTGSGRNNKETEQAMMMVSTFWLAAAFVVSCDGHLLTAGLVALPWFLHRRMERGWNRLALAVKRLPADRRL
jgi:hypothetical protein